MDDTGVLGLLEELSILLEDSKPVFGKNNLRQVEIATALEIIDEIRDIFPSEFAQARQIVRERQALLDDAEAEANRMRDAAAAQSKQKLVAAQRAAAQQLEQSKQQAEAEVRQMMLDAEKRAAQTTAAVLEKAGQECEQMKEQARTHLDEAVQLIVERVVNR